MASPPATRDDFEVAIVCALPLEYDAVVHIFDQRWDEDGDPYGRAPGDQNNYTTGRIGRHDVVLALLPNMGKSQAAGTAAALRASFPKVTLALVTGVCGGVPKPGAVEEMILGDVVVSTIVVQYDLGRLYSDSFEMKDTLEDSLGRPTKNIRNLVGKMKSEHVKGKMEEKAAVYLEKIQEAQGKARKRHMRNKYNYPGASTDRLFESTYQHKHHGYQPACNICGTSQFAVCKDALKASCDDLKCDERHVINRQRIADNKELEKEANVTEAQTPSIFVGRIGSGDTVIKSAPDRDAVADKLDLLAFEMEGAGVFDEIPCVVVKGVCDYADSHKNKSWQDFAAATAASVAKTILDSYPKTDKPQSAQQGTVQSQTTSGSSLSPGPKTSSPGGVTFNGPISGGKVIAGISQSGGTSTYYM